MFRTGFATALIALAASPAYSVSLGAMSSAIGRAAAYAPTADPSGVSESEDKTLDFESAKSMLEQADGPLSPAQRDELATTIATSEYLNGFRRAAARDERRLNMSCRGTSVAGSGDLAFDCSPIIGSGRYTFTLKGTRIAASGSLNFALLTLVRPSNTPNEGEYSCISFGVGVNRAECSGAADGRKQITIVWAGASAQLSTEPATLVRQPGS